jgi:2-polyprenyl-3-methyl-5-hydroxy-6-metoxy-1,4-benzoquinol methylase/ribosomal protein S27AE
VAQNSIGPKKSIVNQVGLEEHHCPLCGGVEFVTNRVRLLTCTRCGLTVSAAIWQPFANEMLEEEWFGESYQAKASFWVKQFEKWNNKRTLARLVGAQLPGRRLLEVGVGSGSFLKLAQENGYDVSGCDISAAICRRVHQCYGIPMHSEPLAAIAGENLFDIVVMNHVVEHVDRPIEFMREVHRLLAPGGIVHIAVPNIACWEARLTGWNSYEPYHLAYFTPETFRKLIEASGLFIESIKTHESFSGWFLAVVRSLLGVNRASVETGLVKKSPGGQIARDRPIAVEQVYRLTMVFTGVLSWPLRILQGMLGYGDEVICLARRPSSVIARSGSR